MEKRPSLGYPSRRAGQLRPAHPSRYSPKDIRPMKTLQLTYAIRMIAVAAAAVGNWIVKSPELTC